MFVDELFDGAARHYNHIGRMLDLGYGPMYRRQALQRAGLTHYWDTIDRCVPPETILDVLRSNGFVDANWRVYCDFLSEYVAVKRSTAGPNLSGPIREGC